MRVMYSKRLRRCTEAVSFWRQKYFTIRFTSIVLSMRAFLSYGFRFWFVSFIVFFFFLFHIPQTHSHKRPTFKFTFEARAVLQHQSIDHMYIWASIRGFQRGFSVFGLVLSVLFLLAPTKRTKMHANGRTAKRSGAPKTQWISIYIYTSQAPASVRTLKESCDTCYHFVISCWCVNHV